MKKCSFKYLMAVVTEKDGGVYRTQSKTIIESWMKEKKGQKLAFEVSDKAPSYLCPPKVGDFVWSERRGIIGTVTRVDRMTLNEYSIHYKDTLRKSPRRFIEDSCNLIKLEQIFPETDVNNCSIIGYFGGKFFFFASEEEAVVNLEYSCPVYKVLRNKVPEIGDTVFVNSLNDVGGYGLISKVVDTRQIRFSTGGTSSTLFRLENGNILSRGKLLVVEKGRTVLVSSSHKNSKKVIIVWNGVIITNETCGLTPTPKEEEPKKTKKKRAEDVYITYEEYEITTDGKGIGFLTINVSCVVRYKKSLTFPRYTTRDGLGHASETFSAPLSSFSKKEINKVIRKLKGKALFNALNQ